MDSSPASPPTHGAGTDAPWPLTGRDAEVDRALASLRGPARAVFLHGHSGSGKTRIAREILRRLAADDGWATAEIAGNQALRAIPLATLAPVLTDQAGAAIAAASDRVGLFAAAQRALVERAGGRRVAFVVDDVTFVDPVSLSLLAQLVASGALTIIATVQEGEPLPDGILPVATLPGALRIDVEPLEPDAVETLLHRALGAPVAHRAAIELHRASTGNPLFLRELVAGALRAGRLARAETHWMLTGEPVGTPALRDVIAARMRSLEPVERDVLERLALCQPLALDEFPDRAALGALASLETKGLLRIDESGGALVVSLAHPQYAAALRDAMPRIRVVSLLAEQADLVEAGTMAPGDELRVAVWRLDAGRRADPALLRRSADLARQARDHSTAERLVAAAIASGDESAEARLLHANVLWSLGRAAEARSRLVETEELLRAGRAPAQLFGALAALRADLESGEPYGSEHGLELLEEFERLVPEQRVSMLLARAMLEVNLERMHDSLAHVEEAAALLGDSPMERALVSLSAAMPRSQLLLSEEAIAGAREAVAYAEADGALIPPRRAQLVLANTLLAADRFEEARGVVVDSLHDGIRHDDEQTVRYDEFLMGRAFWETGRLATAARWFRDALAGAELRGPASLRDPSLAFLSLIAAQSGDLAEAKALRARTVAGFGADDTMTTLADAWIAAVEGDPAAGAALLFARADLMTERGARFVAMCFLHHVVRFGTAPLVAEATERLESLHSLLGSRSPEIARRLAHAVAARDQDAAGLRAAGEEWERVGARLCAAEAYAAASAVLRVDGQGRAAAADARRAAALAAACEGARTPLLRFAEGAEPLTPREREIASLAAQGLSSNEIAGRLFLSARTVNNHLQSVYGKLGIRGRRELQL